MATYNKSEIMKMAWKYVKVLGMSLSEGLKEAWYSAKAKVKRNAPKVKNTNWHKEIPFIAGVKCENQNDFSNYPMKRVTGVYASTIAR